MGDIARPPQGDTMEIKPSMPDVNFAPIIEQYLRDLYVYYQDTLGLAPSLARQMAVMTVNANVADDLKHVMTTVPSGLVAVPA